MYRLDSTYFVRGWCGLGFTSPATGVPAALTTEQEANLTWYISVYEPAFLKLILGDDLYAEYIADPTGEKWSTFNALMFDATLKTSPCANYVFCKLWDEKDTIASEGTTRINGENKARVSKDERITPAWNQMVEWIIPIINYLCENYATICSEHDYNTEGWKTFVYSDEEGVLRPRYRY